MPTPHSSGNFADLLDPRVSKIFYGTYKELPDLVPSVYSVESSSDPYERVSGIGSLPDFTQFAGTVTYQGQAQGYDVTATHVPFTNGIQIERELFDDHKHGIWSKRPADLAKSAQRTRQKHAARIFNNAFSVDTYFYNNSEGVSLCSDSHTTNSGVSTASGFDNLTTASLSAVAVAAARIQMRNYRGDVGEKITILPSKLIIPVDLYEIAFEIAESEGKLDTANNNKNVHKGKYEVMDWEYLTDSNNWFMVDGSMQKSCLTWYDRIPLEFAQAEELDTMVAKWRAYMRYSFMWSDWRFILGASVS